MLLGGDERGRTQRGNNNAYCQANEISFYDWSADPDAERFTDFTRHVIALHRDHAALRRRSFFHGRGDPPDIAWFDAEGLPMTAARWSEDGNHFLAFLLAGDGADLPDDDLLVVLNAGLTSAAFVAPGVPGQRFTLLLHTGQDDGRSPDGEQFEAGTTLTVPPRTVLVAARIDTAGSAGGARIDTTAPR